MSVQPQALMWAAETDFTVDVPAGLQSFDGAILESAHRFSFSTRPPPEPSPEPIKEAPGGCGGGSAGLVVVGLSALRRRVSRRAHSAAASGKV